MNAGKSCAKAELARDLAADLIDAAELVRDLEGAP
jgi:hypothetical protein